MTSIVANRQKLWVRRLHECTERAQSPQRLIVEGRLTQMVGLALGATGCEVAIGDRCRVLCPNAAPVDTEVVGFSGKKVLLMPIGDVRGLAPNARVVPVARGGDVPVGPELLGRVLDGTGQPLDDKRPPLARETVPLNGARVNPLRRTAIREPLDVGVRAINALLTVGQGQRMGLFAGSGLGKSVLLGMMTRYTSADVIVVGLIGERGREVQEFIADILGGEGLARAVVVASPADDPPLKRIHGAALATAIAEYFRDQGKQVLLLMDSLTRFAQAQREIALAIGEPPATRGYPPSVFARLPQLVERAGNGGGGAGGITAFYTVLTEDEDGNDPIAETARAVLDGHIVLSRELAQQGSYPAIDVERSISRAMPQFTQNAQREHMLRFKKLYSTYRQNADLISVGAYVSGSDPRVDEAVIMYPHLLAFLTQPLDQAVSLEQSIGALAGLMSADDASQAVVPARHDDDRAGEVRT